MTRVQQSDELAFNEIYQRYSQRILRYMYRMLRQDEAKANDFLQDVFLKIVSAPEKFDTSKNFKLLSLENISIISIFLANHIE